MFGARRKRDCKQGHRLLTDGTVKSRTVVAFASGKSMHNDTHKRQRFSSWLYCEVQSKCVCSVVASLTGEMAARSSAYHAHGTADSDKSCCYPWFVYHEFDRTLDQQCMLTQARPPMINHLTSLTKCDKHLCLRWFGCVLWTFNKMT